MTFSYRSRPFDTTTETACENEGQGAMNATCRRQITTNVPPGTIVHANLQPSKVNSRETKRLRTKMKMTTNTQIGGTSTRRRALRQKLYDSKTYLAAKKIGSSMN